MLKQISAMMLLLVLTLSFASITFSQDYVKKEVKKIEKTALERSDKETGAVKSISCGPECGFMLKSRNEKELISMTKEHVHKMHKKDVSDKDLLGMIKTEGDHAKK
jgi:predicted small metal-binding protein